MDPFLESQEWEDFHTTMNTVLRESLAGPLEPDYLVRVERRVYVEHVGEEPTTMRQADVAILSTCSGLPSGRREVAEADAATATECMLVMPMQRSETYLVIRHRPSMKVVTVIELLSPSNKRAGGDGRHEYLTKREEFLVSTSHLVELDLLRGGERLPMADVLPAGDFYAIISRTYRRPRASVFSWTMQQPLPKIPIPLRRGDDDCWLDLQAAFTTVYARARYDLSVNYKLPLQPPPPPAVAQWLQQIISPPAA